MVNLGSKFSGAQLDLLFVIARRPNVFHMEDLCINVYWPLFNDKLSKPAPVRYSHIYTSLVIPK